MVSVLIDGLKTFKFSYYSSYFRVEMVEKNPISNA